MIQVSLPDERQIRVYRDILGEVSALQADEKIAIRRDSWGRPTSAGPLSWRWGSSGLVGMQGPLLDVTFSRDTAGRLTGVQAGDLWTRYSRDFQGGVIRLEGAEGLLTVLRDLSGQVVSEEGPQLVSLTRSPTGLVSSINVGDRSWKRQPDAAGRPLQLTGPNGHRLGFIRDPAGRIILSRLASGALLLRRWLSLSVLERIQDEHGDVIREVMTAFDHAGRITQQQGIGRLREERVYGPGGALQTIMTEEGPVFDRAGTTSFGPGEAMVLYDSAGRLLEARPSSLLPDWGIANEMLSAYWDPSGVLSELVGDAGVIRLHHDAFGRLSVVEELERGSWELSYDIRGRLWVVKPPDGPAVSLLWSPSGELLSIGERSLLYDQEGGVQLWTTAATSGSALWLHGGYIWQQGELDQGWPRLTPDGHIALFKGGPLITPRGAIEPISGEPTLLRPSLLWSPRSSPRVAVDPGPLMPRSPWHAPLSLLGSLGAVQLDDGADWSSCPSKDSALPWPDPLVQPPLGPDPSWLPLREDPFTMALICAMVQQRLPLSSDWMRTVFLAEEADVVDIPLELLQAPDGLLQE